MKILFFSVLILTSQSVGKNIFSWRFVMWPSAGLGNRTGVDAGNKLLARMNAVGYNGLFLDGFMMRTLYNNASGVANVKAFVAEAERLGIHVVPMSQYQDGNRFMPQDLREGLPNKGTPFVVSGGKVVAKGDPAVKLANGGFAKPLGNGSWTNSTGLFKIDTQVKRSGNSSARCDDPVKSLVFLLSSALLGGRSFVKELS